MALSEAKRARHREYMRGRYQTDPLHRLKQNARSAVRHAIVRGELAKGPCQACQACGSEETQAHHDDYSKPLEVRWLCLRCHEATHGGPGFHG